MCGGSKPQWSEKEENHARQIEEGPTAMTDDFEEKGNLFLQWLKDNGATLSDGIAFKDYRASEDAGRGVVATRQIQVQKTLSCSYGKQCLRGT